MFEVFSEYVFIIGDLYFRLVLYFNEGLVNCLVCVNGFKVLFEFWGLYRMYKVVIVEWVVSELSVFFDCKGLMRFVQRYSVKYLGVLC